MISVVIPLYNKVRHIKRAIDSVLAQTYREFELIIINDGSTDKSEHVLEDYTDPRIRLIHREHINSWGGHAARNLGIENAKYEFIAFLDADDEWMPDYLETIVLLIEKYPGVGAWSTAYCRIEKDGSQREWQGNVVIIIGDRNAGIIDIFSRYARPFYTSSITIRKKALILIGGFPDGVASGGDRDTWYRLAFRFPIACCVEPKVYYYRNVQNPIDAENCIWSCVRPYFNSLYHFIQERGGQDKVPKMIIENIMEAHFLEFAHNAIVGNRNATLQVARDFMSMKGYRLKGLVMFTWNFGPLSLYHILWRFKRFLRSGSWILPDIRKIYN
ncbi:MAG: glycosyltransferase family 2 protein [Candidatus Electryonea clarkiae]|nr:glycosyltransferase family 2 protein [Candidatus Electryonea clarkiae]MDP8287895.1 glycosyltransferase family 2 protein [Candidatus Electryonea clarkiae]